MKNTTVHILITGFFLILGFTGANAQMPGSPAIPLKEMRNLYGGSNSDQFSDMLPTSDGGYLICAVASSSDGDVIGNHGGFDGWLVKIRSTGDIEWQKTYGGTGDDYLQNFIQTPDGGYILCGGTRSLNGDVTGNHGGNDGWVVKVSSTGTLEWQKAYGGTGDDNFRRILATSDGGYLLAGASSSSNGDVTTNQGGTDAWVVKISNTGTLQWQKTYGGTANDNFVIASQTSDGGYLLSGNAANSSGDITGNHGALDGWVVKINSTGTLQWQKTYGGTQIDVFRDMVATPDGGYLISGNTASSDGDVTGNHGDVDGWVVKIGNTGILEWQKTYGGSLAELFYSLLPASDGGYVVLGHSRSSDGDVTVNYGEADLWAVKVSNTGTLQWQKSYGGTGADFSFSIKNSNGGYCILGYSASNDTNVAGPNHGSNDGIIFKLDSNGNIQGFYDDTSL